MVKGWPATAPDGDVTKASRVAGPGRLVSENVAGAAPSTLAVTVYDPAVVLAVNAGAVARPPASVVTTAVVPPPANVPPGPAAGAVKVTCAPPTGSPEPSVTRACRADPNAVPTVVLWPPPALAATCAAVTVRFRVA